MRADERVIGCLGKNEFFLGKNELLRGVGGVNSIESSSRLTEKKSS